MSDDEADPELLALLRDRFGINDVQQGLSNDTGVLRDAEHIYNNAIDVSIDMWGTRGAAAKLYKAMQERHYSTQAWSEHELHPKLGQDVDELGMVNFIFTMDLLNFSFWSELGEDERYQVEYRGKRWTGYNSLVACLRRALDEGVPITTPSFWRDGDLRATMEHVLRSATAETMPLIEQRAAVLREAAEVLYESYAGSDIDHDVEIDEVRSERVTEVLANGDDTGEQAQSNGLTDVLATGHDTGNDREHDGVLHMSAAATDEETHPVVNTGTAPLPCDHATDTMNESETTATEENTDAAVNGTATDAVREDASEGAEPLKTTSKQASAKALRRDHSILRILQEADHSAGKLVNLLARDFPCFRDEGRFEGRKVRYLKRAQIFVADLWAAFNGVGYGDFHDIAHLTMFADYRVPQQLHNLGVLVYSPPLDVCIRRLEQLQPGSQREQELRGCSIWAVELMRRQIVRKHPEAEMNVNAVLLDFLLYDMAKEAEAEARHDGYVGKSVTSPLQRTT